MRKKLFLFFFSLSLIALVYYLFARPADYIIHLKTNGLPGTIDQTIKLWAKNSYDAKLIDRQQQYRFKHQFQFNDSIINFDWNIISVSDSISKIEIYATDPKNSLQNRIQIPFDETLFEKRVKQITDDLVLTLKEHKELFTISIDGEAEFPRKYVAFVSVNSAQNQKAFYMMNEFPFLNTLTSKYKIESDGQPIIEITDWNRKNDSIAFNFCFPIKRTDTLPAIEGVHYKELPQQKAIKATYHGNYITSDRAWYSLLHYAEKNELKTSKEPLEIFYNNPNLGGNEIDWKAEIFLPLQDMGSIEGS